MAAGVRGLFAFWAGGASSVTPTTAGGVRSPLAFWMGGAGASPAVEQGGMRGLLAFWMGGASAIGTVSDESGGAARRAMYRALRLDDSRLSPMPRREAKQEAPETAQGVAEAAGRARAIEAQFNAANVASIVGQLANVRASGLPASIVLPSGRMLETATAEDDDMALLMFAMYLAMED